MGCYGGRDKASKILKSSNCLINSHFATRHFFANRSLRKAFLVPNYYLGSLNFKQNSFFADFLTQKYCMKIFNK